MANCGFELCTAEDVIYLLSEENKLPPELLSCFQQIITIAVSNYIDLLFRLPEKFSINPVSKQYDKEIKEFISRCIVIKLPINITHSIESTNITLG